MERRKNKRGCYIAIALFIHYIYNTMHTEENITCRSTMERLHILWSPARIIECSMVCKCLVESSIFC